jgi:hypothetical protein
VGAGPCGCALNCVVAGHPLARAQRLAAQPLLVQGEPLIGRRYFNENVARALKRSPARLAQHAGRLVSEYLRIRCHGAVAFPRRIADACGIGRACRRFDGHFEHGIVHLAPYLKRPSHGSGIGQRPWTHLNLLPQAGKCFHENTKNCRTSNGKMCRPRCAFVLFQFRDRRAKLELNFVLGTPRRRQTFEPLRKFPSRISPAIPVRIRLRKGSASRVAKFYSATRDRVMPPPRGLILLRRVHLQLQQSVREKA